MDFRLIYGGSLIKAGSAAKTRAWEKHQLRRAFHSQLARLWETHPVLNMWNRNQSGKLAEIMAPKYEGYMPLITSAFGMVCELDILLLRPEAAGNVIRNGGGRHR